MSNQLPNFFHLVLLYDPLIRSRWLLNLTIVRIRITYLTSRIMSIISRPTLTQLLAWSSLNSGTPDTQ